MQIANALGWHMDLRIDNHPDAMMGLMPFWCAVEFGLFDKRDIEPVFVDRTNVQAIEDMRAGRMDLSFSGPTLTIMARERFNLNTKFVSAAALRGTLGGHTADFENIVAGNHVEIHTPEDFLDRTLGAFALDGGITHSAPLYLFRRLGLDTSRIQWKTMPFHRMPDALADGTIDVAICVEPFVTSMLRRGLGHTVDRSLGAGSLATLSTGNPSLVSNWWTTREAFDRNPELFVHANDAMNEAVGLIYNDPQAALDAMARRTQQDLGLLREIGMATTLFHPFAMDAPEIREMYGRWAAVLAGAGLLDRTVDCSVFF